MDHKTLANQVLANIKKNNKATAIENLTQLIEAQADLGNLWGGLTRIALSVGEINLSIRCAQFYLNVAPNEDNRRLQVAGIYAEAGKIHQAIALMESSATQHYSIAANHFLGTAYSQVGQIELSLKHLRLALSQNPLLGISWLTLSALKKFTIEDKEFKSLQALEVKMRQGNDLQNQIPYWFAYGKALLDVDKEEQAFAKFSIGCQLMKAKYPFNDIEYQHQINEIIRHQNQEYFQKIAKLTPKSSEKFVFIIGLPRTGTTLLQQVLSSHPSIVSAGESNSLALAIAQIGQQTINNLANHTNAKEILTTLQSEYSQLMAQRTDGSPYIIDKSLNINHHLGLLMQLYPNATFINITRDPNTTAWSCFRTFFSQGLPWSFDISNIKTFINGEARLMAHWQSLFADKILQISYEELVQKPEATIKQCCAQLTTEFTPEMLTFYQNDQPVQTASVGQVRQALNPHSLNCSAFIKAKFFN
ncbi:sulfotransferase [Thalassotalea sp. G2M2-11]|uniref:tetratricopeptide repeat-containing sulfotransferase family protein n=1 Tax=Thalassotalea sp. G2M2-11 TaxID=2787627 RepID=UPI0019D2823B|nr:sulfotransferase [Thalassotalea sp. G2M2-11]